VTGHAADPANAHAAAPAHIPVLAIEAVHALDIAGDDGVRAHGTYVDATFGRGGHARLILAALAEDGRLIALDRDADAIAAGGALKDRRLALVHARFGELQRVLVEQGVEAVDGVLVDLGVSSPQLDEPERGFSFRAMAKNGLLNRLQRRLLLLGQEGLSSVPGSLPISWVRPSARVNRARIRRRGRFKLYGFSSIRSLKSCR
jgi:hypothetical protein